jgi:hypothetical protein
MSKPIRFVAAGDSHGDMADPSALAGLKEFIKDYKPDVRVCLGDAFDFRSLRRGVGANDAESAESLKADIEEGCRFLTDVLRPHVWLWGNHEARLDRLITSSSSAIIRDYCKDVKDHIIRVARKSGAKTILPYHAEKGVFRLGPVSMVHGYAHGINAVTKQGNHYATAGGALICGHIHRLEVTNLERHGGGAAFSAGCLCQKDAMDYASHRLATARWGSGWAYGEIDGNNWKILLAHKVGDAWVWCKDIRYYRP